MEELNIQQFAVYYSREMPTVHLSMIFVFRTASVQVTHGSFVITWGPSFISGGAPNLPCASGGGREWAIEGQARPCNGSMGHHVCRPTIFKSILPHLPASAVTVSKESDGLQQGQP